MESGADATCTGKSHGGPPHVLPSVPARARGRGAVHLLCSICSRAACRRGRRHGGKRRIERRGRQRTTGAAGTTGNAGATGTGGTDATAGTTGTGGSVATGTGGSGGSTGAAGSAGTTGTAGATGTGGASGRGGAGGAAGAAAERPAAAARPAPAARRRGHDRFGGLDGRRQQHRRQRLLSHGASQPRRRRRDRVGRRLRRLAHVRLRVRRRESGERLVQRLPKRDDGRERHQQHQLPGQQRHVVVDVHGARGHRRHRRAPIPRARRCGRSNTCASR